MVLVSLEKWVRRLGLQVLGKLHTGFSGCNGKALLLMESADGVMLTGTESSLEAHREQTEKSKSLLIFVALLYLSSAHDWQSQLTAKMWLASLSPRIATQNTER